MKKIVLVMLLAFSANAMAQSACLERVSNEELLNEMSYRLMGGQQQGQSSSDIRLGLTCDSWGTLTAVITDLGTGKSEIKKLEAGSACSTLVNGINAKKNKRGGKLAAACDSWGTLTKLVVAGTKVTLEKSELGGSCATIAESLNK